VHTRGSLWGVPAGSQGFVQDPCQGNAGGKGGGAYLARDEAAGPEEVLEKEDGDLGPMRHTRAAHQW